MLLDDIYCPADVRRLPVDQLPALAGELRREILHTISAVGGHLSSNLGSIELTVALHHAFESPTDRIIWDVGHQTYAHKILTGRRPQLSTVRKKSGISGFPVRAESPYDCFGTAHASTSLSAALGMAVAARQRKDRRRVIAVIGDGALSGGMAFEALNHAGVQKDLDLLIVLNDNEMSISPAVGAITNYLSRILASRFYSNMQRGGRRILSGLPAMQRFARRAHEHLKGMVLPGTLFEEFGFNYVGPVDGHDVIPLTNTLKSLSASPGLQFLHVVTVKGKGYERAEQDPVGYHGVGSFKPESGLAPMKIEKDATPKKTTYTEIFGEWMIHAAEREPTLVGVTPAMREGSGLVAFAKAHPDRYHDVGIAEQHAVTFAAGLACEGLRPVVAIYSTFLQRAYDQLIHDVCIQNLPVIFAIDRGGLVGADGVTHHGAFDLSYLRCIPNLTVMAPADEDEAWKMLNTALSLNSPVAVRYPRGHGVGATVQRNDDTLPVGRGHLCRQGKDLALLAFGATVAPAMCAAEDFDATVANLRFIKPLDSELIRQLATRHSRLLTVEENVIAGGAGSAVAEHLKSLNLDTPIAHLGLPDHFIEHGTPAELLAECGLDADGIRRKIRALIGEEKT